MWINQLLTIIILCSILILTHADGECGRIRVKTPNQLSFNGSTAIPGLFPWLAPLFHSKKGYVCGSSIITKRHLLTAAHCVISSAKDYYALFGRFDLSNEHETNWINRNMSKVFVHNEFNIDADIQRSNADIAIFGFLLEIQFSDYIQPLCLPDQSSSIIGMYGIVSGYGKTDIYGNFQNTPSYVILKSIGSWTCLSKHLGYGNIVAERSFCAGSETAIPCQGDSGGGYFTKNPATRQYTIYGIVSFAIGLCDPKDYVAFVDVPKFIPWINEKITQNIGDSQDPCEETDCGEHAVCRVVDEKASCRCIQGFLGSPPYCGSSCSTDSDCSSVRSCFRGICTDLCVGSRICVENAECSMVNHRPMCQCKDGFSGNGYFECTMDKTTPRIQETTIFTTPKPYIDPDEYVQPESKQDKFDWQLTKTVFKSESNNVLISPLGAKLMLTLLAEASGQTVDSKTRRELERVLPNNKNLYDAKEYFKKVLTSIKTPSDQYRVNFETNVFVDEIISINQRYSSILMHIYNTDIDNVDFSDAQKSVFTIDEWVKKSTNGSIKNLISVNDVSKSVILLMNVIYFQGTWKFGFERSITRDFRIAPYIKNTRKFMEQTGTFYYFSSSHFNAKILRLPYDGRRFSIFFILPNEIDGIKNLVEKLDSNALKNDIWHMDEFKVHVVIPKFKFDISINLNQITKLLNITNVFENDVVFPLLARGGSSEGKLKVSNIIQKSGIVVDEGTNLTTERTSSNSDANAEFIADHPFIFFIEDDTTGAKIFAGRVIDPAY